MNTAHHHDDCVQCLQREVRRLQAEIDAKKEDSREEDDDGSTLFACEKCGCEVNVSAVTCGPCTEGKESCVHCGYSRARHSAIGSCPSYDSIKKFTP